MIPYFRFRTELAGGIYSIKKAESYIQSVQSNDEDVDGYDIDVWNVDALCESE